MVGLSSGMEYLSINDDPWNFKLGRIRHTVFRRGRQLRKRDSSLMDFYQYLYLILLSNVLQTSYRGTELGTMKDADIHTGRSQSQAQRGITLIIQ